MADIDELVEFIYDLMRSAPVPSIVNGQKGKAAFFDRDTQKAQLRIVLEKFAAEAATKAEPCSKCEEYKEAAYRLENTIRLLRTEGH